jgi:transcriptional regulator GlxA family with amidase domain
MSHQDIIQTLIEWIDEHIDQPLNIDVVARKSGIQNGTSSGCSAP